MIFLEESKHNNKHNKHKDSSDDEVHKVKAVYVNNKEKKSFFEKTEYPFSKKIVAISIVVILLLISMFLSAYFRAYPATLPATENWARSSAYNSIKDNVAAQINQQYPNLPSANKNKLIEEQVAQVFEQQENDIETQIKASADYFRSRLQNDEGQTYLLAIDPYQHLRRAENILKNGHEGDELRDGKPFNNHMFAPIGTFLNNEFHVYFIYYFHKFLSIFNPGISMLAASFWVPLLISMLSVIPAFFIARKKTGNFGGFIASFIIALHPVFLGRTPAGFSDTDAYTIFFALLVTWLFLEGFEAKNMINKTILLISAAITTTIFTFAWKGWWYIFDVIIGMTLVYIGYIIFKRLINKEKIKIILHNKQLINAVIVLLIFFVSSAVLITMTDSWTQFSKIYKDPLAQTSSKDASLANYWPNIKTTVAELNPSSIAKSIQQIGGKVLFFIGMLGIILSLVKIDDLKKKDYFFLGASFIFLLILLSDSVIKSNPIIYLILALIPLGIGLLLLLLKDNRKINIEYGIMIALWFAGSLYASTKGTRFLLLLVPAFALAVGFSLGLIHKLFTKLISEEFKIPRLITSIGLILLLLLLVGISPNPVSKTGVPFCTHGMCLSAHSIALNEVPSMNDAWWTSLKGIKNNSSEDAIINSWWDFGHWFKYVADRAVTVDGAGQDYQLAHWMGTVLMTDNEEQAINTLRMLDCGSKQSYETVVKDIDDVMLSVKLIKKIIMQSEEEARQTLTNAGVSQEAIDKTLNYVFCAPPENYLIVSEDMVGKAGVWAHFGSWDFNRAFVYRNSKGKTESQALPLLMKGLEISEDEARDYYYQVQSLSSEDEANAWIAPWPNYFTSRLVGCERQGENIETGEKGLIICSINKVVSQNQQARTVIESAVFDFDNPTNSSLVVGSYDQNSGYRIGSGNAKPSSFVLLKDDKIEKISVEGTTFPYDVIIDLQNNKALISDPRLSESIFTKLFYFDGRYTEHFEKVSDMKSVTGQRIIVWKVKWPDEFMQ